MDSSMDSSEDSYRSEENSKPNVSEIVSDVEDSLLVGDTSLVASSFSEHDGIINDSTASSNSSYTKHIPKTPKRKNAPNNVGTPFSYQSGTSQNESFETSSNDSPQKAVSKSFTQIRTPGSIDTDSDNSDADSDNSDGIQDSDNESENDHIAEIHALSKTPNKLGFLNESEVKESVDSQNVDAISNSLSKSVVSESENTDRQSMDMFESNTEVTEDEVNIPADSDNEESFIGVKKKIVGKGRSPFTAMTPSKVNDSFTQMRSPGALNSESDSDEEFSPKKIPTKNKRKIRTIQSDSDDGVISVPSTRSTSPAENNVINVSSDGEENEEEAGKTKEAIQRRFMETTLKQTTLHNMVKKMSTPPTIKTEYKPEHETTSTVQTTRDVIYCTKKEYTNQSMKVSSLRADVVRVKTLNSTINKNNLPDKGANLINRQKILEETLQREEEYFKKMVVENEQLVDTKPNVAVPWDMLQAGSSQVNPKTWGKKAMETHAVQKALTMDRLKDLHGSLETCPDKNTFAEPPKQLKSNIQLMPHQLHALAWLLWREGQKPSGGILADDMGLGKTITMIALILKSNEINVSVKEEDSSDEEKENEDDWNRKGKRTKLPDGGSLVICPASVMKQWEGEVHDKCKRGCLNVELYHGTNREVKPHRLAKQDIIVTTTNLVMREYSKMGPLFKVKWRRIVLDEAHSIKNYKSQTAVAVCNLRAKSRWCLTGTPVQNKELDLYSLLKFLRCSPFDDLNIWKKWIGNKCSGGQDRMNTLMCSIILRRTKEQIKQEGGLQGLPEKNLELIYLELDKSEKQVYQKFLIFSRTLFAQFLHQRAEKNTDLAYSKETKPQFLTTNPNGEYYKMHQKMVQMHRTKEVKAHEILMLLLRLRQICTHPSLIIGMLEKGSFEEESIEEDGVDIDILDKISNLNLDEEVFDPNAQGNIQSQEDSEGGFNKAASKLLSANNPIFEIGRPNDKVRKTLELVKEIIAKGDKAVVVSQWAKMLHVVMYHFKENNINCDILDGSIPVIKRNSIIQNFNSQSHSMKVLCLSLTAGGVGLNLVGGNHLILLDLHWNPQLESQAQDRVYRVGQKKDVKIYKFVTSDTIEERIKALQDNKLQMASEILTGTKSVAATKLSLDDIKMLFSL